MNEPVPIETDSQSCIKMIKSEKFSNKTKHIDVRYHFVKDMLQEGIIELKYCPTEYNVADLFTKPLAGTRIKFLRELCNVR